MAFLGGSLSGLQGSLAADTAVFSATGVENSSGASPADPASENGFWSGTLNLLGNVANSFFALRGFQEHEEALRARGGGLPSNTGQQNSNSMDPADDSRGSGFTRNLPQWLPFAVIGGVVLLVLIAFGVTRK